jgi:hypothetical protein
MVVFVTVFAFVVVTDKTPEMSTRPLNDASPNVTLSADKMPVNVGDSLSDLSAIAELTEVNDASTVS